MAPGNFSLPVGEVEIHAVRSAGPGGQNVNKVSTAAHLRFDIRRSSLPESCKIRLLRCDDHRITSEGVVVIKSQTYRSLEKNRSDALRRLKALIKKASARQKKRIPTKPSGTAHKKRLDNKKSRGNIKKLRSPVDEQ
ncbi:MAG: aminoacyl-tRNA hydrolase [Victivallales bacterium]|nr:aminoacyl-tRNA hydrolase [Victivallales bacterium]